MGQCRWPDGSCPNQAKKVVYRMATAEELEASKVSTDYGSKWTQGFETNVCDDHLEEAQKVYPMIADKEPQ
jgi:hypothetical protein